MNQECSFDLKEFWKLCKLNKNLKYTEVGFSLLKGDASTRKYYRVSSKDFSYIICYDVNLLDSKADFVQLQGFLQKNGIRVPEIYYADYKHHLILEEDCGDTTLLKFLASIENSQLELQYYKKAIECILQIQNLERPDAPLVAYDRIFDSDKLFFEINFANNYFLNKFLNIEKKWNPEHIVSDFFKPIVAKLIKQPVCFVHRDFHSKNLLIHDETLCVIDFQDARLGPHQYDLVSLLEDCYYDLQEENKGKLIRYYWDNSKIKNEKSFEEFTYIYHLMSIQRVYKAIGSFTFVYNQRKNPYYLKYIGFAMEKLRKLLMSYPEFINFRKDLFGFYYGH